MRWAVPEFRHTQHCSFAVSDSSFRDMPRALLAFIIVSVSSVVVGLVVESLSRFCRGFLFGIATTVTGITGL